ncbi:MAG: hypothetical protein Q4A83_04280 [Bacillota bacterium]|nr:hypothetical protein [Bacillota bacterium]
MKRNAFNVIVSILLILVCLGALASAGWGGMECYALIKLKNELPDTDSIDKLEEAITLLGDNEDSYLEGVDLCYQGDSKLLEGRMTISSGKAQLAEGNEAFAEAEARYEDAAAQLEEGKAELADARAKMEEARPEYEEGKTQLGRLEMLQPMLHTYVNFKNGVLAELPGFDNLNTWYRTAVVPYAAGLGISLPYDVDNFVASMDEQIAEGNAMLAEYEAAEAQLNEAQTQIDEAEARLNEAKQVLDSKHQELDNAADELKNAENQLDYATGQLAEGKATLGEFEEAVTTVETAVAALMQTESVCDRLGNVAVEGIGARLGKDFDIYKHNEDGEIMSLTNGNPRLDYDCCMDVCSAYRGYIKDYGADLGREIVLRIVLNSLIAIEAVLGIIAAIAALRGKARAPKLGIALVALLALTNVYGIAIGFTSFAHPDGQTEYTGLLPFLGLGLLTVVSLLFMVACLLGRRRLLHPKEKKEKPPKEPKKPKEPKVPKAVNAPKEKKPQESELVRPEPVTVPSEERKLSQEELDELNKSKMEYEEALQKYVELRKKFKD